MALNSCAQATGEELQKNNATKKSQTLSELSLRSTAVRFWISFNGLMTLSLEGRQ
jgi:hypothetical protein